MPEPRSEWGKALVEQVEELGKQVNSTTDRLNKDLTKVSSDIAEVQTAVKTAAKIFGLIGLEQLTFICSRGLC